MPFYRRSRRTLHIPITLNVTLMVLNIGLMVCWIVLLAQLYWWSALTIGTVLFVLILVGLVVYLVLTIKEIRLNQRQANFVDSVTHELKTPIASLSLYLETLQMRELDVERRGEFYRVMSEELKRLDGLINQLLEVGRLDAIGDDTEPEDVPLDPLIRRCAEAACAHHHRSWADVVRFDVQPTIVHARKIVLEMIFGNLLDNAIKYGAADPKVDVKVRATDRGRVVAQIFDNGVGVPRESRKKIFQLFYRGGDELERRRKGTGLGLFIVQTLVRKLKGKVLVYDRGAEPGSVFEVELPGKAAPCES